MIIIGGGIAGISLGRALSKRGRQVTLLEAEDQLAYHTSGRSAQQLVLGYGPPAVRELTNTTVKMLQDEQRHLNEPVVWPSTFLMVGTAAEVDHSAYPGQVRLERPQLRQLVPELRPERFVAGALDERSLRVRADAMIAWLAAEATNLDIRLGERVLSATRDPDGWVVTTNQAVYRSQTVINAAGAWADQVAELFGVAPLGLTPLRRTAAILNIDTMLRPEQPMVMKVDGYYYRYEDDRAILASPQEAVASPPEDAQPRAEDVDALIQEIQADTTLHVTGIRQAWTGLRTEADDGVPVIGFDQKPGFFWLAGQSGYGFQTSLGFARLAADLILDGAAGQWVTEQSVRDLSPARFR